jgi:hypothetical protein
VTGELHDLLLKNLGMSSVMVALTVIMHFIGLATLIAILRRRARGLAEAGVTLTRQAVVIVAVVLGLFFVHAVEIWSYAFLYRALDAAPDFETALYFSTVSYASVGYGDVLLDREWRLLGAIEGANGVILLGWSTAFFVSVIARIRALEHDWID